MKKIVSVLLVLMLILGVMCVSSSAATASASLTGPTTVRAGDTITLTFKLNGSGILGASGTLSYDSSQLTLSSTKQSIASPWMVEFNGNDFVAYDNNLTNPINSNKSLFTVTFKVNSKLATGTKVQVSMKNVIASDGSADSNVGTVTYSVNIAAPKSTDNTLKSLTVSNATISPAFSPSVTTYTANVPYEVSKLNLSYQANDSKATVSVNNPTLTVDGTTKVTIEVTSESGSSKTYTITVYRAQDPNYVPSGNTNLSSITVNGFLLSPGFQADQTTYTVWLPYETESIQVSGTAADKKATVEVIGGTGLVAGADNEVKVVCTAENGEKKTYTIIAKRAAAHDAPQAPTTYNVFWVVNGVVTTETYESGAAPSFKGETAKAADDLFTYTFTGWDKELVEVTADVTYVAQYEKTAIGKTVYYNVFWVVDGKVTMETYEEGQMPTFKGETAKAADDLFTYTFTGWNAELTAVTVDITYVAQYTKTAIGQTVYYTVFWVVDGKVTTETYEAGAMPTFKGETAKTADEQYTYTFKGWNAELTAVTADATYVAQYDKTAISTTEQYTVFWVVDGKVTSETYEEGSTPFFSGDTAKAADEFFSYTFSGWDVEPATVTADATYVAQYTKTAIQQPEGPGDDSKPTEPSPTVPDENQQGSDKTEDKPGVSVVVLVLTAVACLAVGVGSGFIVFRKKD